MSRITLLTCTHNRPEVWPLLDHFVRRMVAHYRAHVDEPGHIHWVIVDDGRRRHNVPLEPIEGLSFVRIVREYQPYPLRSFLDNLQAGISAAKLLGTDYLYFIEDDDFRAENYLTYYMQVWKPLANIIGEVNIPHYHLPQRKYRMLNNTIGCVPMLTATAIRGEMIDKALEVLKTMNGWSYDYELWQAIGPRQILDTCHMVAMKGHTPGIGATACHDEGLYQNGAICDSWFEWLSATIGPEDADLYRKFGMKFWRKKTTAPEPTLTLAK